MSTILREISVALGLDVDAASFAEGELAAKAMEKGLEGIVEIGKKAIEFFVDVAKEAVLATDEIDKNAQAVGLSTTAYQELTYVGGLAGVSAEEMSQSFGLLSRNLYAASKGGEEQAKVFAQLGIHVKGADGKLRGADDVLSDIAEKFKQMPDGAQKTATALELFGRAGKRMIPLLNEGSEGLAELRQEAEDLGTVIDEQTVKQGAEIKDNVERLQALWAGIKGRAGTSIFPVLKQLTDSAIAWVKANKEIIRQRLEVILKGIARAARVLIDAFDVVYGSLKLVIGAVVDLIKWFWNLDSGIRAYVTGFIIAGTLAAAPWLLWATALAGILLILNSIRRFLEGKDSLFADWMKMLDDWVQPKKDDPWWLAAIKSLVEYMEKALGIADKLDVRFGPKKRGGAPAPSSASRGPAVTSAESTALDPNTGAPVALGGQENPFNSLPPDSWVHRLRRFVGTEPPLSNTPSLPPGQGVLRAPQINLSRQYNIYPPNGVTAQDVYNLIQQHEDAANEEAAAALGD